MSEEDMLEEDISKEGMSKKKFMILIKWIKKILLYLKQNL